MGNVRLFVFYTPIPCCRITNREGRNFYPNLITTVHFRQILSFIFSRFVLSLTNFCEFLKKLKKHTSQLYRYFSVTPAKFAILTNGKVYKFYSDLVEPNKMDENPFLEVDLSDIKPAQLNELQKFSKDVFDVDLILGAASELRYIDEFKSILRYEFEYPSDELVRFFLKDLYEGVKTKNVVDKYRPILHKAMQLYINGDTGITFNSSPEVSYSIEQSDCLDPIYSDILHRLGYDIENTENGQHVLKDNEIVAKGGESVMPPTTEPWGQRTCYIADPEGNLVEIGSFVKE